jgi:proline dehydrogenase
MLRSSLIYLSKAAWARQIVTHWEFARRAASRFVAGEKLEDAIRVVRVLNQKGINASLDHLGEHTHNSDAALRATKDILEMLTAIQQAGVRSNASIKLTQIGLAVDETLCRQNLSTILTSAREKGNFVRVDMEDFAWAEKTLEIFRCMRLEHGFDNVGLVIQAYLYRSEADVRQLVQEGARLRLCKGAYKESAEVAYPRKVDVDANYDRLTRIMMEACLEEDCPRISADGVIPPPPALATHDERRIEYARSLARATDFPKEALEFQMLNGIRRDLQEKLVAEGFPVRVYVPYGTEWYPYFVRRLAERPANVWFFISNFFRR